MRTSSYINSTCITIVLLLVCVLVLTGCAEKTNAGQVQEKQELTFTARSLSVELPDGFTPGKCFFTDDYFICAGWDKASLQTKVFHIALMDLKQAEAATNSTQDFFKKPIIAMDSHVLASCVDQNGKIYFLNYRKDTKTGQPCYMLDIYNNEKTWGCTKSQDITEALWINNSTGQADIRLSISLMAVDSQERIYFGSSQKNSALWVLDGDGRKIAASEIENTCIEDMALGSDGQVYATSGKNNQNELFTIDAGENSLKAEAVKKLAALPYGGSAGKFITGVSDRFLFSTSMSLYQCGTGDEKEYKLFDWSKVGITGRDIMSAKAISEDEIMIASMTMGGRDMRMTLLMTEKNEGDDGNDRDPAGGNNQTVDKERQTILLTGAEEGSDIQEIIGQFNVSQSGYEVIVQTYESTERLYAEIASGKGPDLINTDYIDVEQFIQKNLLVDLQPFLESSTVLDRENLVDSVCRLNTVQDVLVCIPPAFTVDIITGRASDLGIETGWTIEELINYIEANEGATIAEGATIGDSRYSFIHLATHRNLSKYVDWETGEVSFDQGEFEKLLKFAGDYQPLYDDETSYDPVGRIRDGKVLLYDAGIRNVGEFLLQREVFQEEVAYIGYPTEDGSTCYGLRNIYGFGISSNSKAKDGAWAFIEFLAESQKAEDVIQAAFPTVKSEFEKALEESRVQKSYLDENGKLVERPKYGEGYPSGIELKAYAATQEDTDMLQKLVEGAAYLSGGRGTVDEIVDEEIFSFLNGDKTAEETVRVIQNRVELYVGEQME